MNWRKIIVALPTACWGFLGVFLVAGGSYLLGMAVGSLMVSPMLDEPTFGPYHHYGSSRIIIASLIILIGIGILGVAGVIRSLFQILGVGIITGGAFVIGMEFMVQTVAPILESRGKCPLYVSQATSGMIGGLVIILMGIGILLYGKLVKRGGFK